MQAPALDIAIVHHLPMAGGAPRVLAEYLRARPEHRFTVYTRWPAAEDGGLVALPPRVPVHRFPLPVPRGPVGRMRALATLPRRGRELAAIVDAGGHDVVFAHASLLTQAHETLPFLGTPSLAYAPEPLRSAYEPRESFGRPPPGVLDHLVARGLHPYEALRKRIDRRAITSADRVVTHSRFTAGTLRDAYGLRADVVPLGVHVGDFAPDGAAPERERFVLSVGALHPLKGHQDVITALATIPAPERPRLVVVADRGEIEEALREHAARLEVELDLRRRIPLPELVDLYRRAGAVAAAMVREPFGLTPLEAMAAGAPVVAVGEGGLVETVVDGETGLLAPREPRALGAALRRVLDDRDLAARLAAGGARAAREDWTWERTARGFDVLLSGLVAARGRGPRPAAP